MKKITNPKQTQSNKRGFAARCASAIVCLALLLMGATAFAVAPGNDNFANAKVISGINIHDTGSSNVDATRQSGDPATVFYPKDNNRTPVGSNTVWFSWTAPATTNIVIRTGVPGGNIGDQSTFDTQLGVYTGSLGALNEIQSNEDGPSFDGQGGQALSEVQFAAVQGTVYHIMVSGFGDTSGTIELYLQAAGSSSGGSTLAITITGNGTVQRDPNQPVGGYANGTQVTLTAVPTGTNNTFITWGGDAAAFGSTNPITITMDTNKNVSAAFTTNGTGGTNFVLTIIKTPTVGSGTVTSLPRKVRYTNGEVVTVIARPTGRRTFLGWSGTDESSSDRTNHVTMTSDMTITAAFSSAPGPGPRPDRNAFTAIAGVYNGLFFDTAVSTNCSGYFTARVSKNGKFIVKINKAGKSGVGSGQFGTNGVGVATIGRAPGAINTVELRTDITGVDPAVTGTVTSTDCVATLEGDRVIFTSRNPSPIQGLYTFILPRASASGPQTNDVVTTNVVVSTNNIGQTNEMVVTNSTFVTNSIVTTNDIVSAPGHGFASLSVSKLGQAKIRGSLADGTKFNQSTTISTTGEIPLFVSLYRGQGLLIGWLSVTQNEVSGSPINWKRPAGGILFPDGIDADITVFGSRFDRTVNPFISLGSNAVVEINANDTGASTNDSRIIPVEFSNANTLVEKGTNTTNGLQIKLLPTGLVRGKFTSLVTGKTTLLQGAMVQNTNAAFGYFLSTARPGTIGTKGSFEVRNEPTVP